MTISQLIRELQEVHELVGDVPVLRDLGGAPSHMQSLDLWGLPTLTAGVRMVLLHKQESGLVTWQSESNNSKPVTALVLK